MYIYLDIHMLGYQLRREHPKHTISAPSSNIIGVLSELKDDIVECNQACSTAGNIMEWICD